MALQAAVKYSAWDIWDTPEDGNRYEVIDGELYVSPPPGVRHQRGSARLHLLVGGYVLARQIGELFFAPIGVLLPGNMSAVQPDLVYVANEHRGIITERGIEGTPDLIVEVLSPSTRSRDRGVKMRAYAAAGVPHYWMLDPRTSALEPYRLGDRGYARQGTY